ncbi:MAG TPA: hypothetical protein DF613_14365 [Lachnospiraceae bacterium]|nr:hypothetical protein [Lachnospiraceae bacterium]
MRIYGDQTAYNQYSFLLNPAGSLSKQEPTKLRELADRLVDKDQFRLSAGGVSAIRDMLNKMEKDDHVSVNSLPTADQLMLSHINDHLGEDMYAKMEKLYDQKQSEMKDQLDMDGHASSMGYAYDKMYDEIVQGYKDGTREVWVQDYSTDENFDGLEFQIGDATVRYRKLTEEEELDNLSNAFDKLADKVANKVTQLYIKASYGDDEIMKEFNELKAEAALRVDEIKDKLDEIKRLIDEEKAKKKAEEAEKIKDPAERIAEGATAHMQDTVSRRQLVQNTGRYTQMNRILNDFEAMGSMVNEVVS